MISTSCHSTKPSERSVSETDPAAKVDSTELQAKIESELQGFGGIVGVYVRHLGSGATAAIRADEVFPTASMIKVPILCALYDRIARGKLDPKEKLRWEKSRVYPGSDLCAKLEEGSVISLKKLVLLMESLSDNTASLWLQELAGTGTAINAWLEERGFEHTRMNSRTPGRKADWKRYGWGQTTPREMAELLVRVRDGRDLPPRLARESYMSLCRSAWDDTALRAIPIGIEVASKQGAVSRSRSEVFLVHAPKGAYVCCVITKEQNDTSWSEDNEGFELLRRISALLWRVFAA